MTTDQTVRKNLQESHASKRVEAGTVFHSKSLRVFYAFLDFLTKFEIYLLKCILFAQICVLVNVVNIILLFIIIIYY